MAFAILRKIDETLLVQNVGVRKEFTNEGVWEYLFSYIEFYTEKEGFKYLKITLIPIVFNKIDNFIKANNFIKENEKLLNENISLITYTKEI